MRKTYILDTSVFIHDPNSFKSFHGNDVIIPISVLGELDKLKTFPNEAGKNARVSVRMLDELTKNGDIIKGIKIDNDILVKIDASVSTAEFGDPSYADNQILWCAYSNRQNKRNKKSPTVLVSKDINLRVRARALSILAEDYEADKSTAHELYVGYRTVVNDEMGTDIFTNELIDCSKYEELENLFPNECVHIESSDGRGIALAKKVGDKLKLIKSQKPWGLASRNKEQAMAIDLIMDKSIPLVSLIGSAGSGKTLCAVASALEMVLEKKMYQKLIVYRPIHTVGKDLGYLPGPQPLDAKILTPSGWTTMGELTVGSEIISRDGQKTKVLGIYPKGTKSVYKVTTTDGTSTECCEDHLWLTQTWENKKRGKSGSVKSTKEIYQTLKNKKGKINHYLPRNESVQFNEQQIPIPPYLMGCILGDGSISNSICISNTDKELIERVSKESNKINCYLTNNEKDINYTIRSNLFNNKPAQIVKTTNILTGEEKEYASIGVAIIDLNIRSGALHNRCLNKLTIDNVKYEFLPKPIRWQNPIKNHLHNLGLSGKKAYEKFIPDIYKYNSVENRINLLRGLMDTDGTIKKNGEASFATTSLALANDVIEIVRSLGGRARLKSRNRVGNSNNVKIKEENREIITKKISYEFNISLPQNMNPFYIDRKASRHSCKYMHAIGIESISYVGEKPVQCIMVENPEHLYVTDDFIVTHNTLDEKLAPQVVALNDTFEFLFSSQKGDKWKLMLEMYKEKGIIEIGALAYVRGRSIPNSLIICDETQNLSRQEVKTLLSRLSDGSKAILIGDIEQIDNSSLDAMDNGLTRAVETFKTSRLAAHVTLTKGERSELATEAAKLL